MVRSRSCREWETHTLNALIAEVRLKREIVLPTAFMASNASMFPGGDTCHRVFGLPVIDESRARPDASVESSIRPDSRMGRLLAVCGLIIIDEVSMLHCYFLKAIDALLRSLTSVDQAFGGKIVVVTGDFKQTTPVIKGANRDTTIATSACMTELWQLFRPVTLSAVPFTRRLARRLVDQTRLRRDRRRLDCGRNVASENADLSSFSMPR